AVGRAGQRPCKASTMNHPMRSGRGRVGCDGQPVIAGGVLVLAGHRFVPFKKAPALVFHPEWLYPGEKLRNLAPMVRRNPPKTAMPLNRDPERDAGDHHRGHPSPGPEVGESREVLGNRLQRASPISYAQGADEGLTVISRFSRPLGELAMNSG